MDDLLLAVSTCLSCFIVASILFQFMNDRYNKAYQNKGIYYLIEIITIIVIAIVNLYDFWNLNLVVWVVAIIII